MITVYDVQTFYGTKAKTFQHLHNAERYYDQLCYEYDPALVEFYRREVTHEEFVWENLED